MNATLLAEKDLLIQLDAEYAYVGEIAGEGRELIDKMQFTELFDLAHCSKNPKAVIHGLCKAFCIAHKRAGYVDLVQYLRGLCTDKHDSLLRSLRRRDWVAMVTYCQCLADEHPEGSKASMLFFLWLGVIRAIANA